MGLVALAKADFSAEPPSMERLPSRHSAWIARCVGRGELAPLGPDDVAGFAAHLSEHEYAAGAVLFREGDLPASVHIVRHGSVELSRQVGRRRAVLQLLRPGDVFGDVPLLVRMREPFDARAIEASTVLSIESVELFRLLDERPRLARRWLVSVAQRMAGLQSRLVDLLADGLDAQLASVLAREAEEGVVRLNQASLASLLGAGRPSVNRVLKRLESEGLVRVGYGQVEVLDPVGLLTHSSVDQASELVQGKH